MVPEKGTFGAVLSHLEKSGTPPDTGKDNLLETSAAEKPIGQRDPWTT